MLGSLKRMFAGKSRVGAASSSSGMCVLFVPVKHTLYTLTARLGSVLPPPPLVCVCVSMCVCVSKRLMCLSLSVSMCLCVSVPNVRDQTVRAPIAPFAKEGGGGGRWGLPRRPGTTGCHCQ